MWSNVSLYTPVHIVVALVFGGSQHELNDEITINQEVDDDDDDGNVADDGCMHACVRSHHRMLLRRKRQRQRQTVEVEAEKGSYS